ATRAMLSVEVRERMRELTAIANRQDANGEYLFAGYAVRTEPFQRSPGGAVQYAGDSGVRAQLIAPGQTVPDGHSGDAVFVRVPQANGTFVTDVAAVNTGNAWIDVGTVIDYAAWVPDNYTIVFTAPDSFEIRDSGNALVASGSYVSGAAIAFRGISVAITGTPASGDRFSVRPAASESLFATLDRLLAALSMPLVTSADRAVLTTKLTASLHQLTQGVDHLLAVRAEVGARVSAIDSADAAREAFQLENQRLLSQLQDVDYAAAVSLMNQQLLALQAAQQSYTRIAQLSLFNYL
ncbi:MAG: flagellar hook-associated protein FlgL, partial [Steroidobacteraceae bacterium]|nr:flagellar hook-associated protein FlgL [Steroidobacteraceae bacterium]